MRRLVELRGPVPTQDGDGTFVVAVCAAAAAVDGAHASLAGFFAGALPLVLVALAEASAATAPPAAVGWHSDCSLRQKDRRLQCYPISCPLCNIGSSGDGSSICSFLNVSGTTNP